jgi:hypothetical protein
MICCARRIARAWLVIMVEKRCRKVNSFAEASGCPYSLGWSRSVLLRIKRSAVAAGPGGRKPRGSRLLFSLKRSAQKRRKKHREHQAGIERGSRRSVQNQNSATAIISQIPLQWTTHLALAGPGNLDAGRADWLESLGPMTILVRTR